MSNRVKFHKFAMYVQLTAAALLLIFGAPLVAFYSAVMAAYEFQLVTVYERLAIFEESSDGNKGQGRQDGN